MKDQSALYPSVGVGVGAGIISKLSQTVRHALNSEMCRGRVAWDWMEHSPSLRIGVCYSLFF